MENEPVSEGCQQPQSMPRSKHQAIGVDQPSPVMSM